MAFVESTPPDYQKIYPHFNLKSTTHNLRSSRELLLGCKGLVVLFTCNHCPYAKAIWGRIIRDASKIRSYGFEIVAINPNIHPNYPDDSFEKMIELKKDLNLPFEYLVDENQEIAKQFNAQCTPDLYVLNNDMTIGYRGAYDDDWKNEMTVKHPFLLDSLQQLSIDSKTPVPTILPSMGCSIKWQNVSF
jgi:peroxiredoxin